MLLLVVVVGGGGGHCECSLMHAGCCGSSLYAFITIYLWVVVVGRALLWAVIVAVIHLSFLCVDCG